MVDLSKFTTKELCEIEHNLNAWKWDDRLGEKPDGWDGMPDYKSPFKRRFIKTKIAILLPIMKNIKNIVGQKEIYHYHHTCILGHTEDEFQKWYDKEVSNRVFGC